MTKGTLEKSFPEFSFEEQQVMDILMKYDGPNNDGLTVLEALEDKISEKYTEKKNIDKKKKKVKTKPTIETNEKDRQDKETKVKGKYRRLIWRGRLNEDNRCGVIPIDTTDLHTYKTTYDRHL